MSLEVAHSIHASKLSRMSSLAETMASARPFSPTVSQFEASWLEQVEAFVAESVAPHSIAWDQAPGLPDSIWEDAARIGLLGILAPKEYGGLDLSTAAYCEACRLLAQGDPALAMNLAAINSLAIGHIVSYGTPEQKEKHLPGCISGKTRLAWALTEPDAGSDARRVQTFAAPNPDRPGWFKATGEKMFITNAMKAHLVVLVARTSEKELSAFLMETDQPGFQLKDRIPTVGVRASYTSHFLLNDADAWHTPCRFEEAIGLLYRGRLGIAAMALGIAEKAHRLAVDYSTQREQFNRRLCDMQSVQNMIADSEMEIEAARLLLAKGAWMMDNGQPVVKESSMAKLYASEAANRATNRAIQIHGGRGMVPGYLVEKLWRDAKLTEIGEGCSEIQRMVIAKQVVR